MKPVATVALALSFAATTGLAQAQSGAAGRLIQRAEQQREAEQSQAEAAKPQAPPPRAERPERSDGGARQGGPRGGEQPQARSAQPAPAAVQVVPVQTAAPQQSPRDRGEFRGRRAEVPTATPTAPETRSFQSDGGRRRHDEVQADQQPTTPPPPRAPSVQTAPPPRAPLTQTAPTAPRADAQQQGGSRDGDRYRDGRRDGSRQGSRDGDGSRNWDGRRDRDGDHDGWNRDGGRGGWDRDGHGPQIRPDWASRDGRHDRDRNRPQYDPRRYQHDWRSQHRYRIGVYITPFDYYDRYWNYDEFLPWGWYGPRYWIDDWFRYGLPPPPAGYEWVRVGNDAVLVDVFDGRIRSVVRLLFW
jgi:Ni/Co efflux regulator RcnB